MLTYHHQCQVQTWQRVQWAKQSGEKKDWSGNWIYWARHKNFLLRRGLSKSALDMEGGSSTVDHLWTRGFNALSLSCWWWFLRANLLSGSITLIHGLPLFHLVGPAGPNLHLEKPSQDESGFHPRTIRNIHKGLQTTYRHRSCCSRCFVCRTSIGTQKFGQVQGLTLPPTPFLPCRI